MECNAFPFRAKQSEVKKSLYKTRDSSTTVGMENLPKIPQKVWNGTRFHFERNKVKSRNLYTKQEIPPPRSEWKIFTQNSSKIRNGTRFHFERNKVKSRNLYIKQEIPPPRPEWRITPIKTRKAYLTIKHFILFKGLPFTNKPCMVTTGHIMCPLWQKQDNEIYIYMRNYPENNCQRKWHTPVSKSDN